MEAPEQQRNDLVDEKFRNIRAMLDELRETCKELRAVVEDGARWRRGTEEVLDSMIERIDSAADDLEEVKRVQATHQTFIDRFTGGKSAVLQLIATLISAAGILIVLFKSLVK